MNKTRCCIIDFYRMVTVMAITYVTWKIVHCRHYGFAERTGRNIDVSISAAAEKLEKTAIILEEWADSGGSENLGKGLDKILSDTNKALEIAMNLVRCASASRRAA